MVDQSILIDPLKNQMSNQLGLFIMWNKDYEAHREDYDRIFKDVMRRGNHETSQDLENDFGPYVDRKHCIAVASATDALQYSLLAMGIGPGDEVLVSDYSWISSASCIAMVGAIPVFCDVDLESYHISLDSIKRMTTSKTKALIYTPLFGNMTDTKEIEAHCQDNGIRIIEDAAQALGSSLNGKKAGSLGDASCISFNTNKVIAGISISGMFVTDDDELANHVGKIRRHGSFETNNFEMLGFNSRSFLLNNEIIRYRLSRMKEMQEQRQRIALAYNQVFTDLPIQIQEQTEGLNHNYHKYTIRMTHRSDLIKALRQKKIDVKVHYNKPLSMNTMWDNIAHRKDETPNADLICKTILTLPCHHMMTSSEIEDVIETVEDWTL